MHFEKGRDSGAWKLIKGHIKLHSWLFLGDFKEKINFDYYDHVCFIRLLKYSSKAISRDYFRLSEKKSLKIAPFINPGTSWKRLNFSDLSFCPFESHDD